MLFRTCRCPSSATVPSAWLKVTGSIMTGSLALLPVTVHASSEPGQKDAPPPLALEELSLYAAPPRREPPLRPEREAGQLEERVATLRRSAAPYTGRCLDAYARIEPKVRRVLRLGDAAAEHVRSAPKDLYPRAAIIGFTGVVGLFLARGSRVKKLLYPAGLVALSASLYYPEQAAAIAKSAGETAYDGAVRGYAAAERLWKPEGKPK
ncbi:MICOS complex subunit MIC26-like [Neosynchiropus ocellatus]